LWCYSECISTLGELEKYARPRWESNLVNPVWIEPRWESNLVSPVWIYILSE
jgi:hypothetical protein